MLASYHNHSTYSDGKAPLTELVAWAKKHQLSELGLSDHLALHPSGSDPDWAMPRNQLETYVQDVLHHQRAQENVLKVRLGLEVDWYPGAEECINQTLEEYPWDYIIGSVHEVAGFTVDHSAAAWKKLTTDQCDHIYRQYWKNIRSLAKSGLFDIVAHLDLTKKFGFFPSCDVSREVNLALDAIAAGNLVVELNTAGWHKPVNDAYPSESLLKQCYDRSIPVTISADAHQPDHLMRDYPRAADRLRTAGYHEVARFAGRSTWFESIDEAVK